jgi:hypothetical protein
VDWQHYTNEQRESKGSFRHKNKVKQGDITRQRALQTEKEKSEDKHKDNKRGWKWFHEVITHICLLH